MINTGKSVTFINRAYVVDNLIVLGFLKLSKKVVMGGDEQCGEEGLHTVNIGKSV